MVHEKPLICSILTLGLIIVSIVGNTMGTSSDWNETMDYPDLRMGRETNGYRLLEHLLHGYDIDMRPRANHSESLLVTIDITINKLLKLDERDQILVAFVWIRMFWNDDFLRWNPSDYGGVRHFAIDRKRIWTPDITLYNSVDKTGMAIPEGNKVTVTKDGDVGWYFASVMKAACALNIRRFPFDSQICPLRFGFWAYDIKAIDIINLNPIAQIKFFEENGEWRLTGAPASRHELGKQAIFPYIDFYLMLERYPNFHFLFLVVPFLVIILVTVFGFLIPVDIGDKLALTVTNLLSLVVLQLLVAERLPPQSTNMPIIAMFFCSCILLVALMVALHVFVIMIHKGSTSRRPPLWAKKLFFPTKYWNADGTTNSQSNEYLTGQDTIRAYKQSAGFSHKPPMGNKDNEPPSIWSQDTKKPYHPVVGSMDPLMKSISENLLAIRSQMAVKKEQAKIAKDWRNMAEKIDKILFAVIMFVTLIVSVLCTLGPQFDII